MGSQHIHKAGPRFSCISAGNRRVIVLANNLDAVGRSVRIDGRTLALVAILVGPDVGSR